MAKKYKVPLAFIEREGFLQNMYGKFIGSKEDVGTVVDLVHIYSAIDAHKKLLSEDPILGESLMSRERLEKLEKKIHEIEGEFTPLPNIKIK